jgi:hypothetical protein
LGFGKINVNIPVKIGIYGTTSPVGATSDSCNAVDPLNGNFERLRHSYHHLIDRLLPIISNNGYFRECYIREKRCLHIAVRINTPKQESKENKQDGFQKEPVKAFIVHGPQV